jgi:hypothetical protein
MVKGPSSSLKDALALKTCKKKVRRGSKQEVCGKQYLGAAKHCGGTHLLAIRTGFCIDGNCEGTARKSASGKPMKTCDFIETCPCKCHDELAKLFELTGQDRIVVDSSGYAPEPRTYWMPSDDPLPVLSSPTGADTLSIIESPAPDRVPATVARAFTPTPTGRAARGELELWVKQACDVWLIDEPGEPCTPSYIANEIAHDQGITAPSVGAVDAVLKRWVALGFAVTEKKPTRFIKYTEDGIKLGLEKMKADAKRKSRLQIKDDRRNLRR